MDLYFDCFSGISGDMTLGAFIGLGVPVDHIIHELRRMPLNGFDITVSDTSKHGIMGKNVHVHDLHHHHDAHDQKQSHGTQHHHDHPHQDHHHDHGHDTHDQHEHDHHDQSHHHGIHHNHAMDYGKIRLLIEQSPFSDRVKSLSLEIFERIADAESAIHGCPKDKVHFHEVGAIDAIVDIVGTALCVDHLNIGNIRASALPMGSGFVTCAHGRIPVPAPATVKILEGIPVYGSPVKKELVTPTGAAIIATLATEFGELPPMRIEKTAYGAGKRDLVDRPNLLRVFAGSFENNGLTEESITVLETTIDDMNPEHYGYIMERLFDDNAVDVLFQPVFMKKNRPGTVVSVYCKDKDRTALTRRILIETTSTGVRYYPVMRTILPRTLVTIQSPFGDIAAKRIERPDGSVHITPEFEAMRDIAIRNKMPIRQIYEMFGKLMGDGGVFNK